MGFGFRSLKIVSLLVLFAIVAFWIPTAATAETLVAHHSDDLRQGDREGAESLSVAFTEDGLTLEKTPAGYSARGTYLSPPTDASIPFNAVAVHWLEASGGDDTVRIHISILGDGGDWTPWMPVIRDEDDETIGATLPDGRPNPFAGEVASTLIFRYPAREGFGVGFRYRIELLSADGVVTPLLERITVTFIDSTRYTPVEAEEVPSPDRGFSKPSVVTRGQWGARSPSGSVSYCSATTHLCLHHTANQHEYNSQSLEECKSNMRGIQAFHMDVQGWIDIGYNYGACKHGHIFEGRYGGDNVRAAHDAYNCPSMGIGLMGYFHPPYNNQPTSQILDSTMDLFAWKADQNGLDPYGVTYYSAYGGNMNVIYGHHQVGSTACPGDVLIPMLGDIRDGVYERIEGGTIPGDEVIVDNGSSGYSSNGFWSSSTTPGYYGTDYEANGTGGSGSEKATWRATLPKDGVYGVYVWYNSGSNRAADAPYTVQSLLGSTQLRVNQRTNGSRWVKLGSFPYVAGQATVTLSDDAAAGYNVIADAVRFVHEGPTCGVTSDPRSSFGWAAAFAFVGLVGLFVFLRTRRKRI